MEKQAQALHRDAAMLQRWLAPLRVDTFLHSHLRRAPFARPGAARSAIELLDWNVFGNVLGAEPTPDVLVAVDGRLSYQRAPRTLEQARTLMQRGLGIAVRHSERHDQGLAAVARDFARDLPGRVQLQLYATPAGTHTFGWHYDAEDVFVVQTAGMKDYYLRDNTVTSVADNNPQPNFSAVRRETSPLLCCRLLPGDWLYIPARWWHLVESREDALSISIGVVPDESLLRATRGVSSTRNAAVSKPSS